MWWYLTRATGIVATVLGVAALVWGFFFSSRNMGDRRRPAWWLDLHNYLGGLTLLFAGIHIAAAYIDTTYSGIGLKQILVPNTYTFQPWAMTWGVLATYLFVIAVFTSWPRRLFSRRTWRVLHLGSVFGVVFAGLHGWQMGSDAKTKLFQVTLIAGAAVGVYATFVRVFGVLAQRQQQRPAKR